MCKVNNRKEILKRWGQLYMKRALVILLTLSCFVFVLPVSAQEQTDLREEIIYNILIDRFNNGDQTHSEQVRIDDPLAYHGGDITGIMTKLDDLKTLGFTTISLSPVMQNAPDGYHGYWIEDFYEVEDQFGTMEDLKTLVEEAQKRDINVILEFVMNYVSTSHPFVTDPDKEHWFKEVNHPENLSESTYWLDDVAMFDLDQEDVQSYLFEVAEFWMTETGVDGFKLHAADQASPDFVISLTSFLKDKDTNFCILANILDDEADIDGLRDNPNIDAIDNYVLFEAMTEVFTEVGAPVTHIYEAWENSGDEKDLLFVDNQDTARFANNIAENGRNTLTTWKLALTYLYTTPGIPSLYQGSELKMYGPGFPENQQMMQFNSTDPDLEEFHHRISSLHEQFPVLSYGDFEQVEVNEALSVFKRSLDDEVMYIAINNDEEMREATLTEIPSNMQLRGLFGDNIIREDENGEFLFTIPRESVEVFIIEENMGINWLYITLVTSVFVIFVGSIIYLSRKQKARQQT